MSKGMKKLITLGFVGFVRGQPECYMPIDVMFLQDTTGSFMNDLPNVVRQIPSMVDSILTQNPESYFGVAEFKDKPYYWTGEKDDFCYKLNGPLSPSVDQFKFDYSTLYASGGGDKPESQFQALIDVALDPNVGWRPIVRPAVKGQNTAGARLVVMSTDAKPHLPADYYEFKTQYSDIEIGQVDLAPFPDDSTGISPDDQCRKYNWPSDTQVKTVLTAQNIYLVILTPDDEPPVVDAWRYVNDKLLGQPSDFLQIIKNDSSDLLDGVLKALKSVTETACKAPPVTPPPTLPPPTLAPTTLPPTPAPTTLPPTPAPTLPPPTPAPTTLPPTPAPTTLPPTLPPPPPTPAPTTLPPTLPPPPPTEAPTTAPPPPPPTEAPTTAPPPTLPPTPVPTTAATTLPVTASEVGSILTTVPPVVTPPPTVVPPPTMVPPPTATPPQVVPPPCLDPCPPHPTPCCHHAAVVIKVNDRPKKLVIDYEK